MVKVINNPRTLTPEEIEEFNRWMDEMQAWAKEVGYKEEDVSRIIKEYRREKRAKLACASSSTQI